MAKEYILSLDQGTTSSRAVIFNARGEVVGIAQKEIEQIYPHSSWVEHNPREIWATQSGVMREVLEMSGLTSSQIAAIGITNQRETTIVWEKKTGRPIYNAIVWQCRRTADYCQRLKNSGWEDYIRESTGLVIDAYFSATKLKWILDNVPGAREQARAGELLFGTVDSYLIWNLTRGELHITDYSNAARTMLYNIEKLDWDERLLELFDIPRVMLPEVRNSSEIYGYTHPDLLGEAIPIGGIAGDQQAALFGQRAFLPGEAKNTYGTGCFMLMNTGEKSVRSKSGLLTTIAWGLDGKVTYALEGSVFIAGAVIQWLRDELGLIKTAAESEALALSVEDTNGVYLVPAFAGLGTPHWDMYARGVICGLTRGVNKRHIVRAALESIAYQVKDIAVLMSAESGISLSELRVDGGASANNFLMQFQADILLSTLARPHNLELTALGAAYLAGLAVGFWKTMDDLPVDETTDYFHGTKTEAEVADVYKMWLKAVDRSKSWAKPQKSQ